MTIGKLFGPFPQPLPPHPGPTTARRNLAQLHAGLSTAVHHLNAAADLAAHNPDMHRRIEAASAELTHVLRDLSAQLNHPAGDR